jgi:hypothetical protein
MPLQIPSDVGPLEFTAAGALRVPGPLSAPGTARTTAAAGAAITAPANDTNENTLVSVTIPGGSLGPNGWIEVLATWSFTGSTNAKNMRVKYGGTTFNNRAVSTAANISLQVLAVIRNRGLTNSQFSMGGTGADGVGTSNNAPSTGNIDSTADQILLITAQKATGSETLTLEGYSIRTTYAA